MTPSRTPSTCPVERGRSLHCVGLPALLVALTFVAATIPAVKAAEEPCGPSRYGTEGCPYPPFGNSSSSDERPPAGPTADSILENQKQKNSKPRGNAVRPPGPVGGIKLNKGPIAAPGPVEGTALEKGPIEAPNPIERTEPYKGPIVEPEPPFATKRKTGPFTQD